jgi:hypothetical protein
LLYKYLSLLNPASGVKRRGKIMKIKDKEIKIASLFMVMLIVSMVLVQVVSASADVSQNKENADSIDISKNNKLSENDLKTISKNVKVLENTTNEKIASFTKKDGSIGYAISWKDEKNPNRVNFAFVDQNELVSQKLVSASSLDDSSAVVAAISAARTSFGMEAISNNMVTP